MVEQQVRYIMQAMDLTDRKGVVAVNVRAEVQDRFNTEIQHNIRAACGATGDAPPGTPTPTE
ncbi:putative flavoprotein involved in K+ transport [Rhodococcus wratislaviensis IFP 2016]|nr:putative flavoprotein involved in K+ transport [Rhodococcus wratislaviensis IFP 2016]